MCKAASCTVLAALLCLTTQALGSPGTAGNCGACHYHMNLVPGATKVTNADGTATPNPARGTLKVIQMQPGQTRALQFDVGGWTPDPNGIGVPD